MNRCVRKNACVKDISVFFKLPLQNANALPDMRLRNQLLTWVGESKDCTCNPSNKTINNQCPVKIPNGSAGAPKWWGHLKT